MKMHEIGRTLASSVNRRNFNRITPLVSAAGAGMLDNVNALLNRFQDVEEREAVLKRHRASSVSHVRMKAVLRVAK